MRYKRHGEGEPWGRLYNTKRWQEVKEYVIERDKGRCQECGKLIVGRFIIHHKELANQSNFFNTDILELVCQKCHNKITFHYGMRNKYKVEQKNEENNDLIKF